MAYAARTREDEIGVVLTAKDEAALREIHAELGRLLSIARGEEFPQATGPEAERRYRKLRGVVSRILKASDANLFDLLP